MKSIFSPEGREVLEQFVWSNVLVAFDFDGTLAPIVAVPERAEMRKRTRALLCAATKLLPIVVISGRAQIDARRKLKGADVDGVVGNHGIEPWQANDRLMHKVAGWRSALDEWLLPLQGVQIEDKVYSVAIHFRRSREKKRVRASIDSVLATLGDVRVIPGKQVVNVLPKSAPHKGIALERERRRLGCDTAIYVGDDRTDEDVFELDQPGRLLSIRVGATRNSQAAYFIRSQREIDEFLRLVIEFRRRALPLSRIAR
ncbi:MAG: trehalose-phosphatase [Deltaproteobacteria bacterium]|nr:trehalose-phosphatase [Deltaproteobacteria bacterium]